MRAGKRFFWIVGGSLVAVLLLFFGVWSLIFSIEAKAPPSLSRKNQSLRSQEKPWEEGLVRAFEGIRYSWKPKTVFRFEFHKETRLNFSGGEPGETEEVTRVSGFLVLEIETLDPQGFARASMRFDSPHVLLPARQVYNTSSEVNRVEEDVGFNEKMARAMEETLGEGKWKVALTPWGRVTVEGREPAKWEDWVQRVKRLGKWPKKSALESPEFIEKEILGLRGFSDSDLLFVLPSQGPGPVFESLRPPRIPGQRREVGEGYIEVLVEHLRVLGQPKPEFWIPRMAENTPPVRVRVEQVETISGRVLFDQSLGMLDRLEEEFRVRMVSELLSGPSGPSVGAALKGTVHCLYRLGRVVPQVRKGVEGGEKRE